MVTLIFVLTCYGFCNSVIYGSIFEGFRNFLKKLGTSGYSFHKLFSCFMCLPVWAGFILSYTLIHIGFQQLTPWGQYGLTEPKLLIFLNGMVSGAGVWLIHTVQEAFERAFVKETPKVPEKDESSS